jgi:hypothetical protein
MVDGVQSLRDLFGNFAPRARRGMKNALHTLRNAYISLKFRDSEIVIFARHSIFTSLLLSCLACWLSCVIVFGEFPELLSLTDNTSNDFAIRRAPSAEGVRVLSVAKQGSIQIFARAVEHIAAELRKSTVQDTSPTRSALFILNSVLRR